jgi:hypothetical protein
MLLRFWRLATILATALGMGVAECHLLEMPAKSGFESALWLTLLQRLYPPAFGPVGGAFEVAAVLGCVVLVVLVRGRGPAFGWTVVAAACVVASHAAFWLLVAPVNATLLPLAPDALPADWTRLRDQWETTHAVRAVLQLVALGALAYSVLVEVPAGRQPRLASSGA